MLDASEDLITLIDRDLRYVEVNRAYLEARNLQRDQVIGATVPQLWGTGVLSSPFAQAVERALAGERVHYEATFEITPGHTRPLEVSYEPVATDNDTIDYVIITTRDRSEVERSERAWRALWDESEAARRRAQSELAQLREHLARSIGQLHEALYTGDADPAARLRMARMASDEASVWLEERSPDQGHAGAPRGTSVDLGIVLEQALSNARLGARDHGTMLAYEPHERPLLVVETSARILRLRLEELIGAAIAKNPAGTPLMVRATTTERRVRVEVVPGGSVADGSPVARVSRHDTHTETAGTGDSIAVAATPTGEYRLWLDLDRTSNLDQRPDHSGPIVLVVDDHAVNRQLCRRILEVRGVQVDEADCGQAALDAAAKTRYDAILLDCRMAPMDGFEVARRLREREAAGAERVPIIAMTAGAMAEDRERCRDAGMDAYLTKPVRIGELETALHQWTAGRIHRPAPPPLDPAYIESIADPQDPGLYAELARLYLGEAQRRSDDLERAAKGVDLAALRAAAHALSGSSSSVGAVILAQQLQQLEAEAEDSAARNQGMAKVRLELERVCAALRGHLTVS